MARLSLYLLGSFWVSLDGEPVTAFESDKVRALLAYLVMESDRPHRRETLTGLFWPERPEQAARHSLSQALFSLRQVIGDRDVMPPFLIITPQSLRFNPLSDLWLDVTAFAALLSACEKHHHRRLETCHSCIDRLEQAVTLYRGNFLEGFSLSDSAAFEEWSVLQRERFHRLIMEALHSLVSCHERHGQFELALQHARRQVELDPWREAAHRQLMRLLALSGQRSAALAQYETSRHILAEELGVELEEETTALYERIRDGSEWHVLPPVPPHNLPTSLIPFVGRETELTEIRDRLQDPDCRLLTLVGPGGIGKTRLALEVATALVGNFIHGVYLISLAQIQSAEAIVPAVADVLGLSFYEEGAPRQRLLDYLRQKNMLLIMDSFEHLLGGVSVVTDILESAPGITILVTSQTRLNVQGEHVFSVGGMDFPILTPDLSSTDGRRELGDVIHCSAARLFLQGARRALPNWEPKDDDWVDVIRICRLVQGTPLGILLAAAWAGMLTPAEIATEIGHNLDFLKMDWRGTCPRHRSIRAVFDHSWRLLTEPERMVFQALSVFHGGFTREAAQQITGASLQELIALADKSLLHRTATGRYEVHGLLQQYAAEKLEQTPDAGETVYARHGAYYAAALQQWANELKSSRQPVVLEEIEADSENVRSAWGWAVAHQQMACLDQALEGLCLFYSWSTRYQEGEIACQQAVKELAEVASGDGLLVLAKILVWQSFFATKLGHTELARQLLRQSLALLVFVKQNGTVCQPSAVPSE